MLSDLEQVLAARILARRDALLDDLHRYVEIPTGPGGGEGLNQTRELMSARLRKLGASIDHIPGDPAPQWLARSASASPVAPPPTLLCRREHHSPKRVLLSGHLDTVHDPAGPFLKLSLSPDGKTAKGPGCVDMKGGLVIALHALEALAECGVAASWSFILNSDEETGSYHSDAALRAAAPAHDFALALEPATPNGGLVVERYGSGQFLLEARGRAAHVGRDFTAGVSAVNSLAEHILAAAKLTDPSRGLIVNIGPLQGGVAANVVPELARAWGNVRYAGPALGAELRAKLESLATDAPLEDSLRANRAHVSVLTSFNRPAKPLTAATERLALAARRTAEDLGQQLPFDKTGGVCDGNNLQDAGLPTIDTLGVRGGGLHTPDEWIELESLTERCALLAILIARLCAGHSA